MLVQQPGKLYLPAISIIAVVLVLLVLIGISTYRNLDREERRAVDFLDRHGRMLLTALEAGARSAMTLEGVHEDPVGGLLAEFARNEAVAYIYLCDREGRLVHYARGAPPEALRPWHPQGEDPGRVYTRILTHDDGSRHFELAKPYTPLFLGGVPLLNIRPSASQMGVHTHSGDTLVVGLSMQSLTAARQSDRRHALFMGSILLFLGGGAFFFLFVIQSYYRINHRLEASRDYIRQVIESMPNGLISVGADGLIEAYNQTAASMLGHPSSDLEGRRLSEFFDVQRCGIQGALEHGKLLEHCEISYSRADGQKIIFGLSVAPLRSVSAAGAVVILRDLTEIRALTEKVRHNEKLAAVGTLAAGVAHEIRNPLSSIRGFAHYLDHRLADRPQEREYAQVMVREIDRINRVVSNLLTLARPAQVEKRLEAPAALLEHVITLVAAEAESRKVVVRRQLPENLPDISVDGSQLTQAVLNLVLNALQAVEPGGRIEVGAQMRSPDELAVWVEDDGPGIDAATRERIFDPFFTTRSGGTGLGLAIVRQIVDQHGGRIELRCPPPDKSQGCRLEILLPVGERRSAP